MKASDKLAGEANTVDNEEESNEIEVETTTEVGVTH